MRKQGRPRSDTAERLLVCVPREMMCFVIRNLSLIISSIFLTADVRMGIRPEGQMHGVLTGWLFGSREELFAINTEG